MNDPQLGLQELRETRETRERSANGNVTRVNPAQMLTKLER